MRLNYAKCDFGRYVERDTYYTLDDVAKSELVELYNSDKYSDDLDAHWHIGGIAERLEMRGAKCFTILRR